MHNCKLKLQTALIYQGRIQGESAGGANPPSPPPPEITCGFLIQLVFCNKKKLRGLLVLKQSKRRVHPLLKKILDPPLYIFYLYSFNLYLIVIIIKTGRRILYRYREIFSIDMDPLQCCLRVYLLSQFVHLINLNLIMIIMKSEELYSPQLKIHNNDV